MCEVHKFNVSTTIWRKYLDSLTKKPKGFDRDPIVSHKSAMLQLSRGSSIWNLEVNEDLVQIQKYCEEFIFPFNHHTQSTEDVVQEITTCSETGILEEYASTLISLFSVDITPINCVISKKVEGNNRKGNSHMTSGVGDNRQSLSCQSKLRETSGAENLH